MAINTEELNEEQKKEIGKLYNKYLGRILAAIFLYLGFLFFANFAVVILASVKNLDGNLKILLFIGNAVIAVGGLRGTLEEKREILLAEVQKVLGTV